MRRQARKMSNTSSLLRTIHDMRHVQHIASSIRSAAVVSYIRSTITQPTQHTCLLGFPRSPPPTLLARQRQCGIQLIIDSHYTLSLYTTSLVYPSKGGKTNIIDFKIQALEKKNRALAPSPPKMEITFPC